MGRGSRWRSRRWDELSWPARVVVMLTTAVQISLAVSAWADLAQRPAVEVRGTKRLWALVIAVNFVGPIAYFVWGRRG